MLCTANQCRSPMAEVLLQRRLDQVGVAATVSSAGLHPSGSPATAHGVATMAERGLDLGAHRSRQLSAELLAGADLVVGMAREHVREAAVIDPSVLARAFTLKELVRRGEAVGPRSPHEDLARWLARVGEGRRREDLLGVGLDLAFDVEDPVGQSRSRYEDTADELDSLLGRFVALAWPGPGTEATSAAVAGATPGRAR